MKHWLEAKCGDGINSDIERTLKQYSTCQVRFVFLQPKACAFPQKNTKGP